MLYGVGKTSVNQAFSLPLSLFFHILPVWVNILLPVAFPAVNNIIPLSPVSPVPATAPLMYVFYCAGIASNRTRSSSSPCSPVITAGLGRPLQQKQEAVHSTGHDPSHSAPWVKEGPPRRNTGKFRSHQQGVEGYLGRRGVKRGKGSLSSLNAHLHVGEGCTSVEL